eukprot:CAMPEP_0183347234 /NCGR_PEP_ID=MMETSP0164_2-20130417/12117_1 /TAXON_ID=221442 /ORGANISM="Coccolithus pelagicus ssp braarudi, Strain PLY182g" /LENGTH=193 /DNA_ID=CAMNT_0025518625 /DNA_START=118 /DNA_END=700 /DNA_ORIENTATION=+
MQLAPQQIELDLVIAYPYRSHWSVERMKREEQIELGARALWGPRFHSKGHRADRVAVTEAVEGISDDAADRAIEMAHTLLASAREGSRLLVGGSAEGFRVRAMRHSDWEFLVSLCDKDVRAAFSAAAPPFTGERLRSRWATDAWITSLFDEYGLLDEWALPENLIDEWESTGRFKAMEIAPATTSPFLLLRFV